MSVVLLVNTLGGVTFAGSFSNLEFSETSEYASHVAILYDKELGLTEAEMRYYKILKLLGVDGKVVEKSVVTDGKDSITSEYSHIIVSGSVSNNLSDEEILSLGGFSLKGIHLITDSKSKLAIRMGLNITNETRTIEVAENINHKAMSIKYREPVTISVIETSPDMRVLTYEKDSGIPLETVLDSGAGKVLYLACP